MSLVKFQDTSIELDLCDEYVFLLSTKEASKGFGCSEDAIRQSKSHNQHELIEGKHFITVRNSNNAKKIMWTKRGIVRLGFFIKSERAKQFRDWAEDYVIEGQMSNAEYQRIIILLNSQNADLIRENENLKRTIIRIHDGFHIQLEKTTNFLQLIDSTKNDGNNLNTETIAGHKYWGKIIK